MDERAGETGRPRGWGEDVSEWTRDDGRERLTLGREIILEVGGGLWVARTMEHDPSGLGTSTVAHGSGGKAEALAWVRDVLSSASNLTINGDGVVWWVALRGSSRLHVLACGGAPAGMTPVACARAWLEWWVPSMMETVTWVEDGIIHGD